MQTTFCRLVVVYLICFSFLLTNAQKNIDSLGEAFLERPLYIMAGFVFYRHAGFELSAVYFHEKNWVFMLRSWSSGWDSPEYPAPAPGQFGRVWPYAYLEFSAQAGRWKVFPHNFFVFVSTGPGYVNYQFPIRRDSIYVGPGITAYKNATIHDRAIGWMASSCIGWRKWGWSLMVIPGLGINSIRTSTSISVALAVTCRIGKRINGNL